MPIPSFFRSPRSEQQDDNVQSDSPASQWSSRFSTLHSNVRSMINGSSIYSNSPVPSNNNTPKPPFLGFLRRPHSPPDAITIPPPDAARNSTDSRSPLRPPHTAGSYMRTIAPQQDPAEPEAIYSRHPADVPLDYNESVASEREGQHDEEDRRRRRHRRHRRRRQDRQATHWIRRRDGKAGTCFPFIKTRAARSKCIACTISGLFLITVLAIYLAIALSRKDLGQEVHILFIMIILATTIFFCHSLIRLFMLALHPQQEDARIPAMTGPEGFHPVRPIRVHLARDEELGDVDDDTDDGSDDPEQEKKVAPPPPAYGLWRSSVRVDPNLLHWQRVDPAATGPNASATSLPRSNTGSRHESVSEAPLQQAGSGSPGPRPPSYASDDGVSYVVEAAPRSVAPSHSGVSDIHPAWRPGYAISEVHLDWPGSVPTRL